MSEYTYRLNDTAIYDYQRIQDHLTDMAADGWRLDKINVFGVWRYRRSYPADVRYEVTYAPTGSAFNSRPTTEEEALAELCAEAGWEKVASIGPMYIYCNENVDAVPLETDELSRIQTIRKALKKNFVGSRLLMMVMFTLNFCMQLSTLLRYPARTLATPLVINTIVGLFCIVTLYGIDLLGYYRWLNRTEDAIRDGLPLPPSSFYRYFRYALWAFVVVYLLLLFNSAALWLMGWIFAIVVLNVIIVQLTLHLCKKRNAPKWANILIPFVVGFFVTAPALTGMVIFADDLDLDLQKPAMVDAPLTLQDFGYGTDMEPLAVERTESPLAAYQYYFQNGDEHDLSCHIVDVKASPFFEICAADMEQQWMDSVMPTTDRVNQGDLWGAEYATYGTMGERSRWFILWDSRIVILRTDWALTEAEIQTAAEILKP